MLSANDVLIKFKNAAEQDVCAFQKIGKLTKIVGLALEASGCSGSIGSRFKITTNDGAETIAEVVGFNRETLYLLPYNYSQGLLPGASVCPLTNESSIQVGSALLGRVLNAQGKPIDDLGEMSFEEKYPLHGKPINPLKRGCVDKVLDVGVRAINGLVTIGQGQRIGLFAGTGVGKSVLLSMIAKGTSADVVVVGLIGERGREVKEFVEKTLGKAALTKAVVVVTPADDPPLLRLQGALTATTIAEYFRDQGNNVLLIMDSLTRFAQAQREIALSIGEPPATKGYPPSVFTKIPRLIERAGSIEGGGSITGIYTVLTEGDDANDPVSDSARGILDGHILLDRSLAERGVYPSISVLSSVSRTMGAVTDAEQIKLANNYKKMYATYAQNEDIISLGGYKSGINPELDYAIEKQPALVDYIKQSMDEACCFEESVEALKNTLI